MEGDFVEVGDGPDVAAADVATSGHVLDGAEDVHVLAFNGERSLVLRVCIAIDPFLDFNGAGAVVDGEGVVGGLSGDFEDLANKGELMSVSWGKEGGGRRGERTVPTSVPSILGSAPG